MLLDERIRAGDSQARKLSGALGLRSHVGPSARSDLPSPSGPGYGDPPILLSDREVEPGVFEQQCVVRMPRLARASAHGLERIAPAAGLPAPLGSTVDAAPLRRGWVGGETRAVDEGGPRG